MKEFARSRIALAYEERLANSLRRAGLYVTSAQGDVGYDLLAGSSDLLKRIVIKYRQSGLLTVNDISSAVDRSSPNVATIIVTNTTVSPYVDEYLELSRSSGEPTGHIFVMRWQNNAEDTDALIAAITAEGADV
jgi:hypothetical protein